MGDSIAKPFCICRFCSLFPPNSRYCCCCCLLTIHYKVYRFLGIGRQSLGAGRKGWRRRPRRVTRATELIDPHRRRRMTSYCHWCSLEGAGWRVALGAVTISRQVFFYYWHTTISSALEGLTAGLRWWRRDDLIMRRAQFNQEARDTTERWCRRLVVVNVFYRESWMKSRGMESSYFKITQSRYFVHYFNINFRL